MHFLLLLADATAVAPVLVDTAVSSTPWLTSVLLDLALGALTAVGAAGTWFLASRGKGSKLWDSLALVWQQGINTIAHVAQVERPDLERYLADGRLDATERAALVSKAWATLKADMGEKGLGTVERLVGVIAPGGAETYLKGMLARAWDAFVANKLTGAPVPAADPDVTPTTPMPSTYVAKTMPGGDTVAVKVNPSMPRGAK